MFISTDLTNIYVLESICINNAYPLKTGAVLHQISFQFAR